MTDEQINIAIAEACGWEGHPFCKDMMGNHFPGWDTPPDYCNDLNAMHEAEMIFTPASKHWMYYALLADMCGSSFKAIRATARQRAEAFLRTVGKWEEVQP